MNKYAYDPKNEIYSLTGLRFLAAFYVFLFHIQIRWPLSQNIYIKNILNQGAIGMSLFFMLSGFVIAYRYLDSKTSYKNYLANRFARIYPIYFMAAVLTLPWIGITYNFDSIQKLCISIAQTIILAFSNIFLVQAWFPQFFNYWNNGGSWSISVEAFCYVLFPFIATFLVKIPSKKIIYLIILLWIAASFPGIASKFFDAITNGIYYSLPIYRLSEFILGACLCLLLKDGKIYRFNMQHLLVVTTIYGSYLAYFGDFFPLYIGHNWITIPYIAFTIYILAKDGNGVRNILSTKLLVWLGKISYCFYSFQALLILLLIQYHNIIINKIPLLNNNIYLMSASLLILILISALAYQYIEEPSRRYVRKKIANK